MSNVGVFRKGGFIATREIGYMMGENLRLTTCTNIWAHFCCVCTHSLYDLAFKAQIGVIGLLKAFWPHNDHSQS